MTGKYQGQNIILDLISREHAVVVLVLAIDHTPDYCCSRTLRFLGFLDGEFVNEPTDGGQYPVPCLHRLIEARAGDAQRGQRQEAAEPEFEIIVKTRQDFFVGASKGRLVEESQGLQLEDVRGDIVASCGPGAEFISRGFINDPQVIINKFRREVGLEEPPQRAVVVASLNRHRPGPQPRLDGRSHENSVCALRSLLNSQVKSSCPPHTTTSR